MVLLHDGVIVKKWSNYNLPGEEELNEQITKQQS
jgi:hypothetical protein